MKEKLQRGAITAACIVAAAAPTVIQAKETQKPNVLFIAIDDMNDWSGCLGNHPKVSTPNIDRLAERGVLFTNAHCQAPVSGPSRSSILTGMFPHNTGIYLQQNADKIKASGEHVSKTIFLTDYFAENGYKTMGVGKIYHGGDGIGFQEYGGFNAGLADSPKPVEKVNFNCEWVTDFWKTGTDWAALDIEDADMPDYQIASWAVEKLDKNYDEPFFLAVGFQKPHVPWYLPQKWFDMFPEDEMVTPPYKADDMDDVSQMSRDVNEMLQMPSTEWLIKNNKWKSLVQSYLACMAFADAQVGRVLEALDNSEYADNTVIVLFSDHGYHIGEKNRTCKHSLWQRATHVPLIFAGAGIEKNESCAEGVGLIDIYPTLVELCGLEANPGNEGISIAKQIKNPKAKRKAPVYTDFGRMNTSIYSGKYHMIHFEDGTMELYDTEEDYNEWYNLAEKPEYQKVVANLKKMLPANYAPYSPFTGAGPATNRYFVESVKKSKMK